MPELAGGDIYAQRQGRVAGVLSLPEPHLAAGFLQYPPTDVRYQSCLFGQRHELAERDQAVSRVSPAHESLHPTYLSGLQSYQRLIVDQEPQIELALV
jgi:hypothetical protein